MPLNTIENMAFAAEKFMPHFQSVISEMAWVPWCDMAQDGFRQAFERIERQVEHGPLRNLFHCSLWASFLIEAHPPAWVERFLVQNTRPDEVLCPDFRALIQGDWIRIPILVADAGSARVAWFAAGLAPLAGQGLFIPEWAGQIMDERFRESAAIAEHLVRHCGPDPSGRRFVLFPMAPANGTVQFRGGSAALALGIGFMSLARRHPVSTALIATGCLDDEGRVSVVGHLDLKIGAARSRGCKCIVIPADRGASSAQNAADLVAVRGFAESWTMASLYSGRQDNLLFVFSRALQEPGTFISRMDSMPGGWIEQESELVKKLLARIFDDSELFDRFSRKFGDMVDDFQPGRAQALAALAPRDLPGAWPVACLRWITARLGLANHQGLILPAREWVDRGMDIVEQVLKLDISLVADFFNHLLVSAHNRYEFSPDLPPTLGQVLQFLEKRYDLQQAFGCRVDLTLGKLYGTLVQNSAFCGPGFIRQTEDLSLKARKTLGEEVSSEFKSEWMRQYSYLTLARLCAGDMDGALCCLETFLGVPDLNAVPEKLPEFNKWQMTLLCRFLSASGPRNFEPLYFTTASSLAAACRPEHPWQLACFNLGRAALQVDDRGTAVRFLEKSLAICLEPSCGPAIAIMALKPLAFLQHLSPAHEFASRLPSLEIQIKDASRQLNPDHFFFLYDRDFYQALAYVRENHDSIFPFSYG